MAKKSYAFNVLSDKECAMPNCKKKLKKRIVEERPTADRCYKCYQETKKR
jgi:hypothetical protein